jgi:hypothetical protein
MMDYSNVDLVKKELLKYNIQNIDELNHRDSIRQLRNIQSKLIKIKKYNINVSDIVNKKILSLNSRLKKDFSIMKEILSIGKDINPFLSKLVHEPNYYDKLFLDWEVKHLHISSTLVKKSYFNKRSNYLLIVMINKNNIYFIDIKEHNDKDIFSNIEYLKIIKKNWNKLLAPHIIKSRICVEDENLTNQEVHEIRKHNINTPICIDGELYMNINNGISGAGTNSEIEDFANNIKSQI